MKQQFCYDELKTGGRRNLLRTCGYGVPSVERAIQCAGNSVNLIVQGEIQPYEKDDSRYKMKEMHLHKLPWPTETLRALGETEVDAVLSDRVLVEAPRFGVVVREFVVEGGLLLM